MKKLQDGDKPAKSLQPATALWKLYRPDTAPYRFRAGTRREAGQWQRRVRLRLNRTVGFQSMPECAPVPRLVEEVDKGDYVRQKIVIRTTPQTMMPVYLLLPKGEPSPQPVILALHGHGYGVKDIVGLWEDGTERDQPDGYHADFGIALCRHGFAVAAPEISCFGERKNDFSYLSSSKQQGAPSTCVHVASLASHLGGSAVGLRVLDTKRLIDYLESRSDLDTNRLGAMGISGGGMNAFFASCLDTRIKASVISGYFSPFRESIFAMSHCFCNYVPGLHEFGEIYDLASLLAPRPLLVEAGSRDPIFPIKSVGKAVARTRRVYDLFGHRERVETDYFEGRHQISGRKSYDFLKCYVA